ncbi:TPA: hypothetical protein ACWWUK_000169 [Citrobacter youngae]
MTVYEMEGFLRGKCLPGDMMVNEGNAQYLVRKFSELQSQNADLAVQLANADSKYGELAAELSAVDKIHNEAVFITDDHYEQCPPEVQKIIRSLAVLQIPACDAFLAEVRAQGVEGFLKFCGEENSVFVETKAYYRSLSDAVDEFSAQLRKGAAL